MHKAKLNKIWFNSKELSKHTANVYMIKQWSSYEGRTADALALGADERRDKLR